jgi:hypothetical protein
MHSHGIHSALLDGRSDDAFADKKRHDDKKKR